MANQLERIRIDKWLWAARFFKTRSLAQDAVELGRVRLDGQRLKSSREVKCGDRLLVERGDERFDIVIRAISSVRGPATVAQTLYEETPESKARRDHQAAMRKLAFEPAHTIARGRPTKRDARLIRQVQNSY